MYACMYTCTYYANITYICMCTHARTHAHTHPRTFVLMHVGRYVRTYSRTCTHRHVCLSCVKVKSVHNILCISCNIYRNIVPEGKKKVNLTFKSTKDVRVKSAHTSQALIAKKILSYQFRYVSYFSNISAPNISNI